MRPQVKVAIPFLSSHSAKVTKISLTRPVAQLAVGTLSFTFWIEERSALRGPKKIPEWAPEVIFLYY